MNPTEPTSTLRNPDFLEDRSAAPTGQAAVNVEEVKARIHHQLVESLDLAEARRLPMEKLHRECSHRVDQLLDEQKCPLSASAREQLLSDVMDEIFGLGPLERFLRDPTVSDILVNGPQEIHVERQGILSRTDASFRDDQHLIQVIQRIAVRVGRRIDESSPMLDARLEDGSRANAIIPPLALDGAALSIRRFGTVPFDGQGLCELGTWAPEMVAFVEACVRGKINILISGGTGSGKTTLLNAMSKWIPPHERVITIEDAAELQLQGKHVVRLETRPANIEGSGEVTQRALLRNCLRMRPDRIIIGEVRGAETLDMLQAMNTGHNGSMTTVHANSPRDALSRVENLISMGGIQLSVRAVRQQMASSLEILIHASRVTGGKRKVISITEITGMEGEVICLHEVFRFNQTSIGEDGHAAGTFEACGVQPMLLGRLVAEGIEFPVGTFRRRQLTGFEKTESDNDRG